MCLLPFPRGLLTTGILQDMQICTIDYVFSTVEIVSLPLSSFGNTAPSRDKFFSAGADLRGRSRGCASSPSREGS